MMLKFPNKVYEYKHIRELADQPIEKSTHLGFPNRQCRNLCANHAIFKYV